MAKRLQHRGGTTSQHSSFTGAVREVTVDTDKNTLVVHDGATAGGKPLPTLTGTETFTNKTLTSPVFSGTATNFTSTGIDDNATSTAITIDSGEKVGIGTSSPSRNLQVAGTNAVVAIKTTDDTYSSVFFGDTSADNIGKLLYDHTDNSLQTIVNNAERMRIDSSGNVGIGTSSPGVPLHIVTGTNVNGMIVNCVGTPANYHFDVRNDNASIFRVDPSGNVGINLTNPGEKLDVAGNISGNNVLPRADNIYSLGSTSKRYNDLFLGDGLFLGGTVAANKLDDYEEGTWTPVFSSGTGGYNGSALSITTATYTKIGNEVNLYCSFAVTGGSSISVGDSLAFTGQPFTPATPYTQRMGVGSTNQSIGSNQVAVGIICATSTNPGAMRFVTTQVNGSVDATVQTHFNMKYPT